MKYPNKEIYAGLYDDYNRLHKEIFVICSDLNKMDSSSKSDSKPLLAHAYCKLGQMASIVKDFERVNEPYPASLFTSALTVILEAGERYNVRTELSTLVTLKTIIGG